MQHRIFADPLTGFEWIDVVDPTPAELEALAERFRLPPTAVQDALDPEHLPKYELLESNIHFFISRAFDEDSTEEADTVREVTRKIAVFYSDQFVISVHRKDQAYMYRLRNRWASRAASPNPKARYHGRIVIDLLGETLASYISPINRAHELLEEREMTIFVGETKLSLVEDLYYSKRKAFVYRRMLRSILDLMPKLSPTLGLPKAIEQDANENGERIFFQADQLLENVNHLLNVHISLSSHRTNEVMRVLTIFSVFFMPLNLIVGIYGMNFVNMPELASPYGYPMVWGALVLIGVSIFYWFHKKGWLRG